MFLTAHSAAAAAAAADDDSDIAVALKITLSSQWCNCYCFVHHYKPTLLSVLHYFWYCSFFNSFIHIGFSVWIRIRMYLWCSIVFILVLVVKVIIRGIWVFQTSLTGVRLDAECTPSKITGTLQLLIIIIIIIIWLSLILSLFFEKQQLAFTDKCDL